MLIAAALATVVVCAAAPAAHAGQRRQMVRTINDARAWTHHHRLHFSERLSRGAAAWARHLMQNQILGHASHVQGEIIEWHTGARGQVRRTVTEWLNSPGHRHVMLGPFRRIGAGKAVGNCGGRRCTIWVVRFGH